MSDLINIILLSLLGSVVGLLGGLIFLSVKKWSNKLAKYSTPFAAGVMITVAFLGLLPESVHMYGENTFLVVLLTIFGSYLFENLLFDLHHHGDDDHEHHHGHASTSLVLIGDTIHNAIDGVAIAAAYLVNPGLGLITAISSLLHEIPHEIGDFGILLKNGFSRKKVFWLNLFSSLFTIVGAVFVYYFAVSESLQGLLMAIAAGMFIYLGVSDFLPRAHRGIDKFRAVGLLLLGAILMYSTLSLIPHSHDHETDEHQHEEFDHYDLDNQNHPDVELHELEEN